MNVINLELISIFIFGSIFGSFINAYSLRVSKKIPKFFKYLEKKEVNFLENILSEFRLFKYSNIPSRSICPVCKNKLKFYHNIPIFSYLFLKGKCSFCNIKIPFIYFISEMFLGIIYVGIYYINFYLLSFHNDFNGYLNFFLLLFIFTVFYSSMIIDLKTTYIPDYTFVLTLIPFIISSNLINDNFITNMEYIKIFNFMIMPILFYYFIYLLNFITYKTLNKIYIGFADIKMLSFIMIIYGLKNTVIIYFISAYLAIFPIIIMKTIFKNSQKEIPYGIYIYISFYLFEFYKNIIFNFLNI